MPRSHSTVICLAILSALMLAGCTEQKSTPINIAGNNWLGYQPLFAAYEKSLLRRSKVDDDDHQKLDEVVQRFSFTRLPSTSSVMRAMSNQQLDGAMLTLDEAIQFQNKNNMDLCVALVMDYSNGADAFVINPQKKPALGKAQITIGYESTALGAFMLRRAMETLAIDSSFVKAVIVEPNDHVSAYQSGSVDALITFEPYLHQLDELGGEVVFSSKHIPNEIMDILVLRTEVWHRKKEDVKQLTDVIWRSGLEMLQTGNPQTMEIIRGFSGLSDEAIATGLAGIHLLTPEENHQLEAGELQNIINQMHDYLQSAGLLTGQSRLSVCRE